MLLNVKVIISLHLSIVFSGPPPVRTDDLTDLRSGRAFPHLVFDRRQELTRVKYSKFQYDSVCRRAELASWPADVLSRNQVG